MSQPVSNLADACETPAGGLRGRLASALRFIEIDRAVGFALVTRLWHLIAGPVNLVLIAWYLSRESQGYYYTFTSLLALQAFFELGFGAVVTSMASHEWARLGLDEHGNIIGAVEARARLVSLGRLVFQWYGAASLLFVLGVGTAGYYFFAGPESTSADWQGPWFALVVLTGLLFWMLPFNALLEGCNQVVTIHRFQMTQAMLSSVGFWIGLTLGAGLWAAVVAVAVSVVRDVHLLGVHYRRFFAPFLRPPEAAPMDWHDEIWPMQSRLAGSGLFGYLAFSLFNPIMFHYHGAVVAGQMGMTWVLVTTLQALSTSWLQTKVPRLGMLIANRDYAALDRLFFRTSAISLGVCLLGAVAVFVLVAGLSWLEHPFAQCLLPPLPTALFLGATVLMQISWCETVYLRAHRREPLLILSMVFGSAVGLSVWVFGGSFGPLGAALGYLGVVAATLVWQTTIWLHCRRVWHQPAEPAA